MMPKALQIQKAKQLCKKYNVDYDLIDIESLIDSSLTYPENKQKILEKIKDLNPNFYIEEVNIDKLEMEKQEAIIREEQEIERRIKSISTKQSKKLNEFYKAIDTAIEKMKLGLCHLLFVKGSAGIGKSYQIRRALVKNDFDIMVVKKISESYLYRVMYENNSENTVLWIKDVMRLFRGQEALEILKGATETEPEERIVTNYTYSKANKNLPKSFIWKGKIIFDFNTTIGMKYIEDFHALVSRGDYIELTFSFDDMCNIMREIAKTKEEKMVTEFLIKNYNQIRTQFNLRTQQKAFKEYQYAKLKGIDWKKHLLYELSKNKSPIQSFLYQFMGDKPIRVSELKKELIRNNFVGSLRTADRRIQEWLLLGELYKVSDGDYNYFVSLKPKVI
ncbi:MAG: hypothetical protein ACTSVB_04070 [Candidatus Heimdallarchaeaceae archaeon]